MLSVRQSIETTMKTVFQCVSVGKCVTLSISLRVCCLIQSFFCWEDKVSGLARSGGQRKKLGQQI